MQVRVWHVVAAISLYLVWPEISRVFSQRRDAKKRRRTVVGLVNPANLCFVNANLQALASSRHICRHVTHVNKPLAQAMARMCHVLNEPVTQPKTASAAAFLSVLQSVLNRRVSRAQNDAHELLQLVLETLDAETNAATNAFPASGETAHCAQCAVCRFQSRGPRTKFLTLSLSVPRQNTCTLHSLVAEATTNPQLIADYKCPNCRIKWALSNNLGAQSSKSVLAQYVDAPDTLPDHVDADHVGPHGPRSTVVRTEQVVRAPRTLILHLSRSIYNEAGLARNKGRVEFGEFLHVAGETYKLVAVIKHQGSHQSGHYTVFRRAHARWWAISDHVVRRTCVDDVLAQQVGVYLLFYEWAGSSRSEQRERGERDEKG